MALAIGDASVTRSGKQCACATSMSPPSAATTSMPCAPWRRRSLAAAEAATYPAYVAAAKATMAWVAWKDGHFDDVVPLATEALELWATIAVTYPFQWTCLWPLIAVRLAAGQLAEAVDASRQLLVPPQQRLPDELELVVEAAGAAWDRGEHQLAADKLADAEMAGALGYA